MSSIDQLLLELNAIRCINLLFVHTDRKEWESVKNCFAAKVLFDMSSMGGGEPAYLSPQQIVDAWEEGLNEIDAIHHQSGNFLVDLEDDQATVYCYGIASHYKANVTGQNTRTFVGSYDFHLVLKDPAWKIDGFKFNLKYIEGNLQLT